MSRGINTLVSLALVAVFCHFTVPSTAAGSDDKVIERKEQRGFPDHRGAAHAAANMHSFLSAKYINSEYTQVRSGVRTYSKRVGNGPFAVSVPQYAAWATATWHNPFHGATPSVQSVRWNRWTYQKGMFVQQGNQWTEYQNGRPAFTFRETGRFSNAIELYDASRQFSIRMTADKMYLKRPSTGWMLLYYGRAQ